MICIGASAILIVGIVRLIINLISAAHRNRVNKKIEKVALEKAAKRRGSFKKRQGFNGDREQEPNLVSPEAVSKTPLLLKQTKKQESFPKLFRKYLWTILMIIRFPIRSSPRRWKNSRQQLPIPKKLPLRSSRM